MYTAPAPGVCGVGVRSRLHSAPGRACQAVVATRTISAGCLMKRLPGLLRDAWSLTRPYFSSEDRWAALSLLGVLIALNLGTVYIEVLFNEWNNLMYTA